ncbi:MAG: hypothetical protein ABWZ01_07220 [Methyloceanibacter sp.]
MIRLSALYFLCCTSPAYSVDCGRAITQFQFQAEDVRSLVMQSDAVVQAIVVSPNNPPQRAAIDWLIPFAQSIVAAKAMLSIYRVAPECFSLKTGEIENGIAERERILNGVANIVRGQLRGLKPP